MLRAAESEIVLTDSSFACLSFLEDETCQLFELMVKKADDSETRLLLDIILQETRKHRELLKHLSMVLGERAMVSGKECEGMGEWFMKAVALTRTVKAEIQGGMSIPEAARKLISFENDAGEEYVIQAHAAARALDQENQAVKTVLENIATDEKGHAEILHLVTEVASKKSLLKSS